MPPLRVRTSLLFPLALLGAPVLLGALAASARAARVENYPVTVQQPDGTPLTVYLNGDEYNNWATDANGYTVVREPATGHVVYASRADDGSLRPTRFLMGGVNPLRAGLTPGEAPSIAPENLKRLRDREEAQQLYRSKKSHNTGSFNNIVVFIRFSDETATAFGHSVTEYNAMFNGAPNTNSMRNYYREVSYGALTITSPMYPTASGTAVVSFQDSHPRSYYQPYDAATNPNGYTGNNGGQRESALLQAAVAFVAPQVQSAGVDTDADNDGVVDNVVFIVDGDTTAWSTLLWPHAAWLGKGTLGGATVGSYNLQPEHFLFDSGRAVGVLCHEMFHSLGSPDLYHYTGNGISPAGPWDLMDSDRNPPQHMTAHMKWKYGGWLPPLPEITSPGHYTLQPATTTNCAYRIRSNNSLSQYFVVEYRQRSGVFENSLPGSGLIVYRIDPSNTGNAGGPPDEVYIYRPGGTLTANGTLNSAYYSSSVNRRAINNATNPSCFLQDGTPGYLDVKNVGTAGSTIAFDVGFVYPPAKKLGFLIQPGPVRPGEPFAPALQVAAQTNLGFVNPTVSGAVTLALKDGTGSASAVLTGGTTLTLVNGMATFPDVAVSQSGSGYVLTASSGSLTPGESAAFSVTPSAAATSRVSVSSTQAEAARPWAGHMCLSSDGKYAAFASAACNLVANDTNRATDVFVKQLSTGTVVRASVSSAGVQANGGCDTPVLSTSGRFVVFTCYANNLVTGDTNNAADVMVRDLTANTTTRASLSNGGTEPNADCYSGAVSLDGRYVAFQSRASNLVTGDTNGKDDIFVRDRTSNTTTRITVGYDGSQANGGSYRHLAMSDDGSLVAFQSDASNLVPGDTNGASDVFVWNRATGQIEQMSVSTGGAKANDASLDASMSPNGRYVVFTSYADNLVSGDNNGCWDIFLRDRTNNTTERISVATSGESNNYSWFPDVSPDGRYVCFDSWSDNLVAGDTNGTMDIFLRDRQLGTTTRINVTSSGGQANGYSESWSMGHLLASGPRVICRSDAANLTVGDVNGTSDVFLRDVAAASTTRVSAASAGYETGGAGSFGAVVSADGRYVVFHSPASNLVPDDTNDTTDVFLRDTLTGATERVSLTDKGAQADNSSFDATMTPDARYIIFTSWAGNLVSGGDGSHQNIYVRDRQLGRTVWVSSVNGGAPNGSCFHAGISADGACVAFLSSATNLVSGDTNGTTDWFWRNLVTGQTRRISVSSTGAQANASSDTYLFPSLSADGRFVCFPSNASNLVANDTNGASDVFVADTSNGQVQCVSVDSTGRPGNNTSWWPDMSQDGRCVAFMSDASNLVLGDTNSQADIFVRDRLLNKTTRVSVAPSGVQSTSNSRDPAISATGRYVAYKATDGNLVSGDTNGQVDIFVVDTVTMSTVRASVSDTGAAGNGESQARLALSADGRYVAYQSYAANLVPNDTNSDIDIFLRGPLWNRFTLEDIVDTLRYASGALPVAPAEKARLNIADVSSGRVDVADAVAIARKMAGLEANP